MTENDRRDVAGEPNGSRGAPARPPGSPALGAVLAAIAVGGVVGAEARNGMGVLIPRAAGQWPWATFLVNASGCLLIGVLMVVILELRTPHPLVRPLLGVGVLGGYTTFSTFSVETLDLLDHARYELAVAYFLGTPALALVAVTAGAWLTRAAGRTMAARHREVRQ